VFLDADTCLQPEALARIAGEHRRSGGLLSVQPYHRMEKHSERLAAFFNIVTMAGTGAFCPAALRTRARGAFGPCLVSRRDDYFATGGHRRARGQVLESIEMARAFREAGHPVALYGGRGALSFRMYPDGLGAMIDGFSKGFAGGAAALSLPMLVMLVAWITGGASCTRHLIQAGLGFGSEALPFWAGLYAAFCAQIYWMLRRIGNFGLLQCLLFPVPLVFFALVFLRSVLLRAGLTKVSWKGRRVS
jgi:4,4'-diaponeurosporenoate glycosyltransferase